MILLADLKTIWHRPSRFRLPKLQERQSVTLFCHVECMVLHEPHLMHVIPMRQDPSDATGSAAHYFTNLQPPFHLVDVHSEQTA